MTLFERVKKPTIHRAICRTGVSALASVSIHYTTSDGKEIYKEAEGEDLFLTLIEALNEANDRDFELKYFSVTQVNSNYRAKVKLHNNDPEAKQFPDIEGEGEASLILQAIIDAYMNWGMKWNKRVLDMGD